MRGEEREINGSQFYAGRVEWKRRRWSAALRYSGVRSRNIAVKEASPSYHATKAKVEIVGSTPMARTISFLFAYDQGQVRGLVSPNPRKRNLV